MSRTASRSRAEEVSAARAGDRRALARLISAFEDRSPDSREISALLPRGHAQIVGVTGPPGVGKSTTTSALIGQWRRHGYTVGVVAVDPSSPFTGGALLGDRIRMAEHGTDTGVYVRSMASRGHLGGLAEATPAVVRVLDGCGFDIVLVETVGVGQSEVEVVQYADTVVILMAPGMGDGIQAAKAGILEIGDVFVVNKADREGARDTQRDLRAMLAGQYGVAAPWRPPVLPVVATAGTGIEGLAQAIADHHATARRTGRLAERRLERARAEVMTIATELWRSRLDSGGASATSLAQEVLRGQRDPYAAADALLAELG